VQSMNKAQLLEWLMESDPERLSLLYAEANAVRRATVGDAVHLRGLIEISSYCARQCLYCGLRAGNHHLQRYRMTADEIVGCARKAEQLGYGTVVLQAGEDDALTADWIASILGRIQQETTLAITLSLGERTVDELALWRKAGADRYLLRFETSDVELYHVIHPERHSGEAKRIEQLRRLKSLGYEAGGGVMVGLPGQSHQILVQDLLTFQQLDLDMIGIGPYLPHQQTPLGSGTFFSALDAKEQVRNSEEMVYKMIALTRLLCPEANIPATTALATINRTDGRKQALCCGANVVMPNLTPVEYRALYQIYPGKACIEETAEECNRCLKGQIYAIGRFAGASHGSRGAMETLPSSAPSLIQLEQQTHPY